MKPVNQLYGSVGITERAQEGLEFCKSIFFPGCEISFKRSVFMIAGFVRVGRSTFL